MMTDYEWLLFWAEGAIFWALRPGALPAVRHNLRQLDVAAAAMPAEYRERAGRFADAVLMFAAQRDMRGMEIANAA
jgi:hypothetical protein